MGQETIYPVGKMVTWGNARQAHLKFTPSKKDFSTKNFNLALIESLKLIFVSELFEKKVISEKKALLITVSNRRTKERRNSKRDKRECILVDKSINFNEKIYAT